MAQKPSEKQVNEFLASKSATITEAKIYKIALAFCNKEKKPFSNPDIAKVYGCHRTNVLAHLNNMIRKGIVTKYSPRFYTLVKPKESK